MGFDARHNTMCVMSGGLDIQNSAGIGFIVPPQNCDIDSINVKVN